MVALVSTLGVSESHIISKKKKKRISTFISHVKHLAETGGVKKLWSEGMLKQSVEMKLFCC